MRVGMSENDDFEKALEIINKNASDNFDRMINDL